jgi:hypothetical protein
VEISKNGHLAEHAELEGNLNSLFFKEKKAGKTTPQLTRLGLYPSAII